MIKLISGIILTGKVLADCLPADHTLHVKLDMFSFKHTPLQINGTDSNPLILVALSILFAVMLVVFYAAYRMKKKSARVLLTKNNEILQQKEHLEKLLADLQENQRRTEAILQAIPDVMFVFDKQGNYLSYKVKKPEDVFYTSQDVIHRNVRDILPEAFANKILSAMKVAEQSGETQLLEHRLYHLGQEIDVEMRLTRAGEEEFLMMARDITSKKKIEEELQSATRETERAMEIKSMFLASLSHEMRTPLSSIIGITSVLEETRLDDEQKEYVDIISMSGNNLLNLINNILDFSKLESGQIQIEKIRFDFRAVLDEVISMLQLKAKDSNNNIVKEIDDSIPEKIVSDPVRLQQILINLINNAIKFTRNGNIRIKADVLDRDSGSLRLKVNVIDDGIGVSQEQKKKIFRAFSQADGTISRKYGGTGLGLTIAKEFAGLMGGEIGVESEQGNGANFWFTIVSGYEDKNKQQEDDTKPASGDKEKSMKPLRILLVEDNLLNQKFAVAILKKFNHKIDIAENGKKGVEFYRNNKYDIILMDIQMPVMDGIEATKRIRQIEKERECEPTRIVAVTAYAMEGDEERFYEAGIDDYLRKPYKADQLISKVNFVA